jgi:hypothetical protein
MSIVHLKLDGTDLPLPRADTPIDMEYIPFGGSLRMNDGTLRVQMTGAKLRQRIYWHGLSKAERDQLFSAYSGNLITAKTWTMPDGLAFSGMTGLGTWSENYFCQPHSGIFYYTVNFIVQEV